MARSARDGYTPLSIVDALQVCKTWGRKGGGGKGERGRQHLVYKMVAVVAPSIVCRLASEGARALKLSIHTDNHYHVSDNMI